MKTINKLLLTLVYISFLTILFHADYYHGTVSQVCGLSQYTIHPNGTVDKSGELQCVKFSQYDLDRQDAFDNMDLEWATWKFETQYNSNASEVSK